MMQATTQPSGAQGIQVFDQAQTADLLNFKDLMAAMEKACVEYERSEIRSPERMVVPFGDGGVMLSMPATACDIGIHKLVNVNPENSKLGVPTIHGAVTVCDTQTGRILCVLDGPEVTGRRTAAVSMLAIKTFLGSVPRCAMIIGTGVQAEYHLKALSTIHPDCHVYVRGINLASAQSFCQRHAAGNAKLAACGPQDLPNEVQVVITLTTATSPVYNEPPKVGRLVIGVGAFKPEMAELGKTTLDGSDLYADDPVGARHEAGDLLQAGIDWARVKSLASALGSPPLSSRPVVFKSVGTGAWDLAASRVAVQKLRLLD